MHITTLTLHPALDRLLGTKRIEAGGLFDVQLRDVVPAGKGINTARVLRRLTKGSVTAAAWVGAADVGLFSHFLKQEGVKARLCPRPCATRWGVTILEPGGRETHFKETMPPPSGQEERRLFSFLAGLPGEAMAVCGSAPPGTPRRLLRGIMRNLRDRFRLLLVDSSGPLLDEAGRVGCDGLKGNAAEIGAWLGLRADWDPRERKHRKRIADRLRNRLKSTPHAILITLGANGAALATREGLWLAQPPRMAKSKVVSPTGCGDAATAGWLWALTDRATPEEALRRAVACGTAKLLSADPGMVNVRVVRRLRANTRMRTRV